ncbi:MAG: SRPBCC family protein, partial [Pseudonocardiales bacterium]
MKPIEFELERTIRAPIDQVFARLVDIEGHNDWMAGTGSMLKHTRQISPGEPAVGTTFVDETSQGQMPGEIVEMQAPHTIVYHWWDKSKSGKLKFEGWPSYHLQPVADSQTLVRHRGKLVSYGVWRLG